MFDTNELFDRLANGVSAEELSNEFQNALEAAQKKQKESAMAEKLNYAQNIVNALAGYYNRFNPNFAEIVELNDAAKGKELARALIPILDAGARTTPIGRRGNSITYDLSELFNLIFDL